MILAFGKDMLVRPLDAVPYIQNPLIQIAFVTEVTLILWHLQPRSCLPTGIHLSSPEIWCPRLKRILLVDDNFRSKSILKSLKLRTRIVPSIPVFKNGS